MEEKEPQREISEKFRSEAEKTPVTDERLRDLEQMRRLQAQMAFRK